MIIVYNIVRFIERNNQMTVQSIAVFMGAQFGNDPQYTVIAEKLGQIIAEKN
ncbi:hypothetical protein GCM10025884_03380 [Leuconostoc gelidum subsp. gelidum]|nr:hypothetical protein GCM10025884_03380 [Leuconostoc gelidum subsp. gelidum]